MITDPKRIRKTDLGNPDVCVVDKYQGIYLPASHQEIRQQCRQGTIGCMQCKKILTQALEALQAPLRERRHQILKRPGYLDEVLDAGAKKAGLAAQQTLAAVRAVVGI